MVDAFTTRGAAARGGPRRRALDRQRARVRHRRRGGVTGEFRFDPLTREWVNIVRHRQTRPNLPEDDCPFCVGGLEAPLPYEVRWFPNRWPALEPGTPIDVAAAEGAGTTQLAAVGAAEVILFSPEHTQ